MSKVLTEKDLVVGKKYVPVSKSGGSTSFSEWKIFVMYTDGEPIVFTQKYLDGGYRFNYERTRKFGIFLPSDVVEYVEPDEESVTDMTVQEFYSGFNLSFLTEEERQTIYTATELFAKGKVRVALTSAPPSVSGKEEVLKGLKTEIGASRLMLPPNDDYKKGWNDALNKALSLIKNYQDGKGLFQ